MLKLTLDMDDVLANTHEKLVDIIVNDFKTNLNKEDFVAGAIKEKLHPKQMVKLYKIINSKGFFADVTVKEGAQETVKELSNYYELFIATACMEFPNSFSDKFNWLKTNFDFIPWTNIVFCGHKNIIHSDYLIDDHPRNLTSFSGEGILFSAAHNWKEERFKRVDSWNEVAELFLHK